MESLENIKDIVKELYSQLEQRGFRGRVVSIQRLQDVQHEIRGRHAQGLFDETFYQERLSRFAFRQTEACFLAASLIVVAVPRPQTRVSFTWNGKTLALVLPPTYAGYDHVSQQMQDQLAEWLTPRGYHVALAHLPLKPLAVRSGLGEYGRNNICYVPGMGSFVQLAAFYSDLPCQADEWREPRMMDRCQKCKVCLRQCPSRAITSERFLLHAERCLVFHNERPSNYAFPTWINPVWHHCLVGCMTCQRACPENKTFLEWIEGDEEFSHEETALLLKGAAPDQLPAATVKKLERLELIDYLSVLPRNMSVFFNALQ